MRLGLLIAILVGYSLTAALQGNVRRASAFWLAWVLPGLGHAVLGKWRKGLFFFASILLTYIAGLWICGWRVVTWEENPFYYVGQYGSGMTTLFGLLLEGDRPFRADIPMSWYDPGLLYACVAGLLNLVLMVNTIDPKAARQAVRTP